MPCAFGSYGVICWSTGLLFVRRTLAVMAGLVPAIHAGPPQERVPASPRPAGKADGLSFIEPLPSWPGLSRPSTPGRRKNKSRLGATGRKADGRKAFRACLRRCAGPSWMAGTSPAMTPRWRRPPPPPCSQFLPHNSQRDKGATFGSYGVICWSTGLLFVRRTLAVMAGLVPAIHAGPPQERVPPRRDRQEGGRSQGFSRLPA